MTRFNIFNMQWVNGFSLLLIVAIIASCKKDDLGEAPRLFRPVLKGVVDAPDNSIHASWQTVKGASSYTVQLSRDTFRTIDRSLTIDSVSVLLENVKWDQRYQLQVRANSVDSAKNSRFAYLGETKTPKFPTILKTATINDVTEVSAIMRWTKSGEEVTEIRVYDKPEGTLLRTLALSAADVQNQYRVVSGLAGSTSYYMELYSGIKLRGYETYTTKAPFSGIVIDLREFVDRPSVLQDTLPLIPSGSLVILKKGLTYNISSAVSLSKTVTITSGDDLLSQTPANIYLTSNFNFAAGSTIDSISFVNVSLTGSDFASKYVFNTTNSANVGKIKFDNCRIQYFRGVTRLQSGTTTVSNYEVNNCLVDSISGYGVITVDNATCKAEKIIIRNSTITRVVSVVTGSKNVPNSVLIENNTFYRAPQGGSYLVDCNNAATITGGVTILNNIFSIGKSSGSSVSPRGIRVSSTTLVTTGNNYATSDYVNSGGPIPGLILYTRPSGEVFTSPLLNDFKIKDNSFPGRSTAGDPRWRL